MYSPKEMNSEEQPIAKQYLIDELRNELGKCTQQIDDYQETLRRFNMNLKDKEAKIQFLEKVIIEKQNIAFNWELAGKKHSAENEVLKAKVRELKEELKAKDNFNQDKLAQLRNLEERRYEKEAQLFQHQIAQKNSYIQKLEKEVAYLSALISEWRAPEEGGMENNSYAKSNNQKINSSSVLDVSFKKQQSQVNSDVAELKLNPVDAGNVPDSPKTRGRVHTSFRDNSQGMLMPAVGVQSPAQSRHYTLKRNKIKKQQIADICLELKYRLLAAGVPVEDAKLKFSGEGDISIVEIQNVLAEAPFGLADEQKRVLLARYLVEDPTENIIYFDQNRVNDKAIVRSIFHQIIPKFQVFTQQQLQDSQKKAAEVIKKFNYSLCQAIGQYNKQLLVTYNKFMEILVQQELNLGNACQEYLVMQMLKVSTGVNTLNFKVLSQKYAAAPQPSG